LSIPFLDPAECFISTLKFLLFCIPVYVPLHKAVERDDIGVERRDKSDVGELDLADDARKLKGNLDSAISLDGDP
jgi:hypothetical protein